MSTGLAYIERLEDVGGRIKAKRDAAGMSLADVHKKSGVYKASLSRIENGSRAGRPCAATLPTLYRVAKAIGCHPAEFFADVGKPPRLQGEARLATLVRKNITRLRVALDGGVTRGEFARLINSSQDVVSRVESGDLQPTHLMLIRIAEGLGEDVVTLFLPEKNRPRYKRPV